MDIKKRIIAFLIVACTVFTLCACGSKNKEEPAEGETTEVAQVEKNSDEKNGTLQSKLTAKEISNIKAAGIHDATNTGVIYYDEAEKFGIFSYDKKDTGAKYLHCAEAGDYFVVALDEAGAGETDVAKQTNLFNLVDANGDILISKEYADFDVLNERYVVAVEVADITTSKDNAILYSSEKQFSFMYEEGDTLYSGNWVVYDVINKTLVSGVGDTVPATIQAKGDLLIYNDKTNKRICIDAAGKRLPENVDVYSDGSYSLKEGNTTTVYKTDGTYLFKLDLADASILDYDNGYYRMSKYADGKSTYYFIDSTGNKVSGDFDKSPMMVGKFVETSEYLYKLDGTPINTKPAKSIYFDEFTKALWSVSYEDGTVEFIDGNGQVYATVKEDEALGVTAYASDFGAYKKVGTDSLYYSFKDKDFTFDGNEISRFLYKKLVNEAEYLYGAFDIISGEKLFDCTSSTFSSNIIDGEYYVVAENADDTYTIYKIR